MTIVLGLGTNLGNRKNNLQKAINELSEIVSDIKIADFYESEALLPENAPEEWNIPFINTAIMGNSTLSPHNLLEAIKKIELKLGRKESYERWSPRIIDIDILIYGDKIISSDNLTIPHKELVNRDFFLLPLKDLWPEWKYPVKGENYQKTIEQLANQLLTKKPDSIWKLEQK